MTLPNKLSFGRSILLITTFLTLSLAVAGSQAGTIVRFSTTMGDFSVELLDDTAPLTVANFLNYVNRDDYNGTYLHRVVDDFVVQGGGFRFEPFVGPIDVPADPAVPNEFNVSNTRGTIAMAKIDGDPDSATSQWFINLDDNTSLDADNGGFTVFGNVLGEGMVILDAIDDLPVVNLGSKASSAPYASESYNSDPGNFVYINVEVVSRFSSAPSVFEASSGLLLTTVNIDNNDQLISMNFNAVSGSEDFVIEANLESVIWRRDTVDGMASYSSTDEKLRIPSLEVNSNGTVVLVENLVFGLSNRSPLQFTLESYEQ
ncbi:MAG: peptidylprolyl isomerase [Pseudomonadales bacterium]|nr:peptidylprolyl isomerase [Pseudomonadales bacterium]